MTSSVFLIIIFVLVGQYFGLGEDMTNTYLVSESRVDCIFIPVVWFHRIGARERLSEVRRQTELLIVDNATLFERYFSGT